VQAARAALAAAQQNRYWPYYSLFFEEQGQENSGYVTSEFLQGLAQKTPGLDVKEWNAQLTKDSFDSELEAARSKAHSAGVSSTPTLVLSGPNGQKKLVGLHTYDEVSVAIERVDGS
jgi:predicted DsbA family dithiol-disulfide isomerase